jgi:hypothetical protein
MEGMNDTNELITIEQASQQAGVPVGTLGYWVVAGILDAKTTREGRKVRLMDVRRAAGQLDTIVEQVPLGAVAPPAGAAKAPTISKRDTTVIMLLSRVVEMERELGRLQASIAQADDAVKRIDGERVRMRERTARTDAALAALADRTDARLAETTQRIERLDSAIVEEMREAGRLSGAIQEQSAALGRLEGNLTRHDEYLARLEALCAVQSEAHKQLEARLGFLSESIRQIELRSERSQAVFAAATVAATAPAPAESLVIPAAPDENASAPIKDRPSLVLRLRSSQTPPIESQQAAVTANSQPRDVESSAARNGKAVEPQASGSRRRWLFGNRQPARGNGLPR